jgi:Na+/proline symporter
LGSEIWKKSKLPRRQLVGGVVLIPFWLLFNWLLGLIAPRVSQEIIWLCSLAVVLVLIIMVSVRDYIIKERSNSEKKRSAVRRAMRILLTIVIPYIAIVVILSAFGVLSSRSQSLAALAFLPILFFAMTLSSMVASRSQLRDALASGTFFASVTAIPFAVAVFMALPVSYQIPYICVLIVAYVSFIYWLRSVHAENRQKRERRTSQNMNQ